MKQSEPGPNSRCRVALTDDGDAILGTDTDLGFLPVAIFRELPFAATVAVLINKAPFGAVKPEEIEAVMNSVESYEELEREYNRKRDEMIAMVGAEATEIM